MQAEENSRFTDVPYEKRERWNLARGSECPFAAPSTALRLQDESALPPRTVTNCVFTCLLVLTLLFSPQGRATEEGIRESVIVIGAGLAGLNGALLLEEQGFEVLVLEARERVGGRIYTLDSIPGAPEAGGNVIGPHYARVLDRAKRLGLELVPATDIVGGRANMGLYIDGQFIAPGDWPTFSNNPLPDALKGVPPGAAVYQALKPVPLSHPDQWQLPDHKKWDRSVENHLRAAGFNDAAIALAGHTNSYGDSLSSTSLLQLYHIYSLYELVSNMSGPSVAIAGGNQRLPEAMAADVTGRVLTGKRATSIQQNAEDVTVLCADGSQYSANYVLSSLPFSVIRTLKIHPPLPEVQQEAIKQLNYANTLLAHFEVLKPYWGKQPPSLWTDTRLERLFATDLVGRGSASNLTVWITGENARYFSGMEPEAQENALLAELQNIYPAAEGALKLRTVVDWSKDPHSRGTWAAWLPGQISDYLGKMAEPAGRLFFAGEHTALTNTGMEGAMESAERAVAEIVAASGKLDGEKLFVHCQGCHSITAGSAHKLGPNLHGFFGRQAATNASYAYSPALQGSNLTWNRKTLEAWLQNPSELVPGTQMIYRDGLSSTELEQLLDYLETLTEH